MWHENSKPVTCRCLHIVLETEIYVMGFQFLQFFNSVVSREFTLIRNPILISIGLFDMEYSPSLPSKLAELSHIVAKDFDDTNILKLFSQCFSVVISVLVK